MASAFAYVLLRPDELNTEGFTYGRASTSVRRGLVEVERIASGRWSGMEAFSAQKRGAEVERRKVTEDEALSGIGTYTGCTVCVARVPLGKPKVWDYGTVVGYSWKEAVKSGVLEVTFADTTSEVPFRQEELELLTVDTYALRPCYQRGVADIMPAEMRSLHKSAHDHFNGVQQSARRSSTTVLRKLAMNPVDEGQLVPLYDLRNNRVEYVHIEHILNYVFYHEGKRRAPAGVTVATTLFSSVTGSTQSAEAEHREESGVGNEAMPQLLDSDDDMELPEPPVPAPSPPKRLRESTPVERADPDSTRLLALRRRLEDDPDMVRDIDQLIALRQANLGQGSASTLITASAVETKSQFKPSRQQAVVHNAMVNGKYSSFDAQLFVESMQTRAKDFEFLPHPGVARGFFGWDFGFRGLSVMHFVPIDVEEERDNLRQQDMLDFSTKNRLPSASKAIDLVDILASLEVLSLLSHEMYTAVVVDLVDAARRFMLLLRKSSTMRGPEAVPELVAWIDDRFEQFRSCLARDSLVEAAEVKNHFQFGHESYARVVYRITSIRVDAALKTTGAHATAPRPRQKQQKRDNVRHQSKRKPPVPPAVVAALPIRRGKKLCMQFLSVDGCPGEGDTCIYDYRRHFVPTKLPEIVKDYIDKTYGGLRVTDAVIKQDTEA